MQATMKRVNAVLAALGESDFWQTQDVVYEVYSGTIESGYGDDDTVLVAGNWNSRRNALAWESQHPIRVANALESVGAECVWYDEWSQCSNCFRAFRTQPDSYSWTPSYIWANECEMVCAECVLGNPEPYIDEYVNQVKVFPFDIPLSKYGFNIWNIGRSYESGWHPGQDDDPGAIQEMILEAHPDAEVLFELDAQGQFDMRFSAYYRIKQEEK